MGSRQRDGRTEEHNFAALKDIGDVRAHQRSVIAGQFLTACGRPTMGDERRMPEAFRATRYHRACWTP
jgi:hypothetical protein